MQTKYFTNDFANLPRERKVEEMASMMMRILYDANADTDANINIVDRVLELRGPVANEPYSAYVNFPWRSASATFKTLEEANAWIESHHDLSRDDYEYSWEITDRRTDRVIESDMA